MHDFIGIYKSRLLPVKDLCCHNSHLDYDSLLLYMYMLLLFVFSGERYFSAPQLFYYTPGDIRHRNASRPSDRFSEHSSDDDSEWTSDDSNSPDGPLWVFYKSQQGKVKAMVDHKYFQNFILLSILINTLSMGIEYHNQVISLHFFIINLSSGLYGK